MIRFGTNTPNWTKTSSFIFRVLKNVTGRKIEFFNMNLLKPAGCWFLINHQNTLLVWDKHTFVLTLFTNQSNTKRTPTLSIFFLKSIVYEEQKLKSTGRHFSRMPTDRLTDRRMNKFEHVQGRGVTLQWGPRWINLNMCKDGSCALRSQMNQFKHVKLGPGSYTRIPPYGETFRQTDTTENITFPQHY